MNGLFVLICNTALPKVPGSKKHEPKDRKTCWPDGALIKIKMGITHLFQWLWFLNELLPRLSGSKVRTRWIRLTDLPFGRLSRSKLYFPGVSWGRGWQLRPQKAVNQKALCALPFVLVFPTTGQLVSKGVDRFVLYPWKSPECPWNREEQIWLHIGSISLTFIFSCLFKSRMLPVA